MHLMKSVCCVFKLPYFSNVQVEPIVVQIDKLDLVLEENDDLDTYGSTDR